jgi:hypothetical protein
VNAEENVVQCSHEHLGGMPKVHRNGVAQHGKDAVRAWKRARTDLGARSTDVAAEHRLDNAEEDESEAHGRVVNSYLGAVNVRRGSRGLKHHWVVARWGGDRCGC